jgi:Nitroreductase family
MAPRPTQSEIASAPGPTLRALIREKAHHTLGTAIELYARQGRPASAALGNPARLLLSEWENRNLTAVEPDLIWAYQWLALGQEYISRRHYENPPHPSALPPEQLRGLERAFKERRSTRIWRDTDVSGAPVDRVIEAGTWAPSACNQQPVRYIVIRDRETIKMIPGDGCFEFAPVIIAVLLDKRSYEYLNTIPSYNPMLDAGSKHAPHGVRSWTWHTMGNFCDREEGSPCARAPLSSRLP